MSLNTAQLQAALSRRPRLLVLAAPGAGKTKTLVERVATLLEEGAHPAEILAITFTRRAATEMRDRLEVRLPGTPGTSKLTICTFHAFAVRLAREYHDRLDLPREFSIRDEADRQDLVLYAARELGLCPAPGEKKRAGQWSSVSRLWQEERVRTRYRDLLREARALDYDGLMDALRRLVVDEEVAGQLRRRWRHVLVDECQDMDEGQQAILDALAIEHLFLVGDLSQAIYGFRGAHPDGIAAWRAREGWRTLELATNYRSLPPIVEAATRLGRSMATPGLDQVAARGPSAWEEEAAVLSGADEPTLLAAVAQDVSAATGHGIYPPEWSGAPRMTPWTWRDCAVLSPTWDRLERLAEVLEQRGIPYRLPKRQMDVWASEECRWLVNVLRVACNPWDHLALWQALQAFVSRVSLQAWAKGRSTSIERERPMLQALAAGCRVLTAIETIAAAAPADWTSALLSAAGLLRADLDELHLETRADRLSEAHAAIVSWRFQHIEATAQDFLDWYAAREIQDALAADEEPPDAVTLLTVHGAKGLEWDCVWILGCEEGALPRAREPGPGMEESRRLAYVGLTRARDRVRLCWSRDRSVSRFLAEMLPVGPSVETGAADTEVPF